MTKMIDISAFLAKPQIEERARFCRDASELSSAARQIEEMIIRPNLSAINKALGQENDAKYLSLAIAFRFWNEF